MSAPSGFHREMRRFRRQMDHLFHEFDRNLGVFPLENDPFFSWNDQMLLDAPSGQMSETKEKESAEQKKPLSASGGASTGSQMAVESTNPQQATATSTTTPTTTTGSIPSTSLSTAGPGSAGQQANSLRPWGWGQSLAPMMTIPRVDIVENTDNFLVNCDLPGVAKENVKVEVTPEGLLSIHGEHSERHEQKDDNTKYHRIERSYGEFKRCLQMPANVDSDAVKAKHENGVLQITLPKKPKAEPKLTKHVAIN